MRIVLIGNGWLPIPPPAWGAIEILIWDMYNKFKELGHECLIVNERYEHDVLRITNNFKPDIVHLHAPRFYNIMDQINCKVKIASSQDTQETQEVFNGFVKGNFYIFAVSNDWKEKYVSYGRDPATIAITPNGVDSNLFNFIPNCLYANKSIYLGMIEERKKQYKYHDLQSLYFVGRIVCEKFKRTQNYLGEWTKQTLYLFLTTFANLVLLSSSEAHSLAVSEALMCGLGVVVSEAASANLDRTKPWITVIPDNKLDDLEYVENAITENRRISIVNRTNIRNHALETLSWNVRIEEVIKKYEIYSSLCKPSIKICTIDLTNHLQISLRKLYNTIPAYDMNCVEIGSFEGIGSILIHETLCKNKNSRLYCIDPFDDEYVKGNEQLSFWNHACNGQKGRFYNNTKNYPKIIPLQGYSDEMILKLEDNSVDFVYIDGDHSPEQVYKDAVNMFPKMKKNAIMLFDDYEFVQNGVITAKGIDKYLDEYFGRYELLFKEYQLAIKIV